MKKNSDPLLGKRDVTSCLYRAVRNYVEKHDGRIVVIGGIQIQEWPGEPARNFSIAIKCTGTKPVFAEPKK